MNAAAFNRRQFTAGLGAVVVAFSLGPELARGQERLPGGLQNNRRLDAWIRINADGGATVFTGKVELGQGVLTALAQIAAEELDLPLSRIEMVSGDTGRTPDEGHTSGSVSIESSGTALRMAAAEVHSILLDLAANRLGTSPSDLTVASGVIAAPDGRKIGYGELVAALDLKREATAKVRPKAASNYKVVGQAVQRLDIPAKVTGGAAYVQDLRLPGMVHGRAVRLPRKLVVAHPLHPHGPARQGAGEQRRVERDVVMTVAAITAGSLGEDAPNGGGFDLQRLGEVEPQREYPLRMRPDRESPGAEFGERAGRSHGGMREVRLAVRRLDHARAAGRRACLLLAGDGIDAAQREQMVIFSLRIGQFGAP